MDCAFKYDTSVHWDYNFAICNEAMYTKYHINTKTRQTLPKQNKRHRETTHMHFTGADKYVLTVNTLTPLMVYKTSTTQTINIIQSKRKHFLSHSIILSNRQSLKQLKGFCQCDLFIRLLIRNVILIQMIQCLSVSHLTFRIIASTLPLPILFRQQANEAKIGVTLFTSHMFARLCVSDQLVTFFIHTSSNIRDTIHL